MSGCVVCLIQAEKIHECACWLSTTVIFLCKWQITIQYLKAIHKFKIHKSQFTSPCSPINSQNTSHKLTTTMPKIFPTLYSHFQRFMSCVFHVWLCCLFDPSWEDPWVCLLTFHHCDFFISISFFTDFSIRKFTDKVSKIHWFLICFFFQAFRTPRQGTWSFLVDKKCVLHVLYID